MKPLCFMVMPYGRKKTDAPAGTGPAEINFDALWDKALRPVIEQLGYEPIRADQDVGALIVHEMLARLYFSDLVLADMTTPNGNVYYEVGIRHACQRKGCVLLAADWSKPLFDVAQMRTVRYPLPEGDITDGAAKVIRKAISTKVGDLARGSSPMHEAIPGYPTDVDYARRAGIRERLDSLSVLQAQIGSVRAAPTAEQPKRALELIATYSKPPIAAPVAHGLLKLLEDFGEWNAIIDFVDKLPPDITDAAEVIELRNLARSKTGNHLDAIGALEVLIGTAGPSSEREGLIGGRYKKLSAEATDPADKARYLSKAIEHYDRGMMLDLNDFYPSSNLPRLYRERGLKGDADRAESVAQLVYWQCRREQQRGSTNEWLRPTMLGAAFDAGNVEAAEALFEEIVSSDISRWKLESTLDDLERSIKRIADPERQIALRAVYERLKTLL